MQTIKINIVDKVATAEGNPFIVCGNSDYTILFNFDKAWDGYNAKTARFIYEQDGEEIIAEVPFAGNSCKAPVIHNAKRVDIGVYAGDILSTSRCRVNCRASILDGEGIEHEEPPEDIYNQIVDICNEAVTAAGEAKATAEGFEATTRETFANALKGNLYGAAVRADDVSPVEHIMDVKVKSKNLLNLTSVLGTTMELNGGTLDFGNDGGVMGSGTPSGYVGFVSEKIKLPIDTYVLSLTGNSANIICEIAIRDSNDIVLAQFGVYEPQQNLMLDLKNYPTYDSLFFEIKRRHNTVAMSGTAYFQLEKGSVATEYTPYVDPSTAKVTRCGKNLLATNEVTVAGTTQWANENIGKVKIAPGKYVASCYFKQAGADKTQIQLSARSYKDYLVVLDSAFSDETTGKLVLPFTVSEEDEGFQIYLYSNATANVLSTECVFTNIMVEAGETATNFEEYKSNTYTPNADGTIEGITSLSPSMTLLTDTPRTVINCEYNKDTNKALTGNMVTAEGTVVSPNADFAEVAEWADGNPDNEDRTGYFVCANVPVDGIVMKKATSVDDVKGVSILAPAFAGNYTKDKLDSNGKLLPKYSYVAIIGFVPVIDNGTCEVGGRCMPDDNGCAIPSSNNMGYQVVNRIDENRVLIIIEPNGDMVQRVKTKIAELQKQINDIEIGGGGIQYTPDYLTFEIRDDYAVITGCDTSISGELVIPSTIAGYPVKEIEYDAFYFNETITSVVIPYGVTNIGTYAFGYCKSLKAVTIPASVTYLDEKIFGYIDQAFDIYYGGTPEQLENFNDYWVINCPNVTVHCNASVGYVDNKIGDIETALDSIIAIQNEILGGGSV